MEMRALCLGQSKKSRPLPDPNHHANTSSKTENNRHRNKTNHRTETEQSHQQQHDACEKSRHLQTIDTISRRNPGKDGNKRAGGSGNLHPRTPKNRNDDTGDNRRINTLLRFDAGGNGKSHRQRQGNNTNDNSRNHVA